MGKILNGRMLRRMSRWGGILENLIIALGGVVAAFIVWHVLLFASFTIPSDSMRPTLLPGDRILVDKWLTGPRLFDIMAAVRGDSVAISRLPSLRGIRRDDVVVFNFVHRGSWDRIRMDARTYYVKRCIALPGDTVEIRGFRYIVNSDTLTRYPSPEVFASYYPADSLARMETTGYLAEREDSVDRWTIRDFGPLVIPGRGMTLPIDTVTFRRYRKAIEWETGRRLHREGDTVLLGTDTVRSHTFSTDYYFVAGDNAIGSLDSRYWGLLPEPFIVGRALLIWSSRSRERVFRRVR